MVFGTGVALFLFCREWFHCLHSLLFLMVALSDLICIP